MEQREMQTRDAMMPDLLWSKADEGKFVKKREI
jgi:hypothetical protein